MVTDITELITFKAIADKILDAIQEYQDIDEKEENDEGVARISSSTMEMLVC